MLSTIRQVGDRFVLDLAPAGYSDDRRALRDTVETAHLATIIDQHIAEHGAILVVNFSNVPALDGWNIADFLLIVSRLGRQRYIPVFGVSMQGQTKLSQRCSGTFTICPDEASALATTANYANLASLDELLFDQARD